MASLIVPDGLYLKTGLWNDITTVKANTALCFMIASGTLALIVRNTKQPEFEQSEAPQNIWQGLGTNGFGD